MRVFKLDVLTCDRCGSKRSIVAFVHDAHSIERFLVHLGLPTRAPPITPAPSLFEEPI